MKPKPTDQFLIGINLDGIQSYIFKTNKLSEIIGSSILIDNLFDEHLDAFISNHSITDHTVIQNTAGTLRWLVSEDAFNTIIKYLPKYLTNAAPSIRFTLAGIRYVDHNSIFDLNTKLSDKKSLGPIDVESGLLGILNSRKTGKPGVEYHGDEVICRETKVKTSLSGDSALIKRSCGKTIGHEQILYDYNKMSPSFDSWMSYVHIDGNGLGNFIKEFSDANANSENPLLNFKELSEDLKQVTSDTAISAFEHTFQGAEHLSNIPFRPILLGGDDITVIIHSSYALQYTKFFLKAFEEKSRDLYKKHIGSDGHLTACAGITYVKKSFPSHFALSIANDCIKKAKLFSKDLKTTLNLDHTPSSLHFFKMEASYPSKLDQMIKRSLMPHPDYQKIKSFNADPYLLNNYGEYRTINDLQEAITALATVSKEERVISKLNSYISETLTYPIRAKKTEKTIADNNKKIATILEQSIDTTNKNSNLIHILQQFQFTS